jgi:acyl carrier protein
MKQEFLDLFKQALEIEGREISLDDNFREYEEWDSLGQLSVIASLDENFGVVIEGAEFASIHTLADLFAKVESLIQK